MLPEQRSIVAAALGLHARAAAIFVRAVTDTGLPVTIRKPNGSAVDARSLLEVMSEDFGHGCEVLLEVAPDALPGPTSVSNAADSLRSLSAVLERPELN